MKALNVEKFQKAAQKTGQFARRNFAALAIFGAGAGIMTGTNSCKAPVEVQNIISSDSTIYRDTGSVHYVGNASRSFQERAIVAFSNGKSDTLYIAGSAPTASTVNSAFSIADSGAAPGAAILSVNFGGMKTVKYATVGNSFQAKSATDSAIVTFSDMSVAQMEGMVNSAIFSISDNLGQMVKLQAINSGVNNFNVVTYDQFGQANTTPASMKANFIFDGATIKAVKTDSIDITTQSVGLANNMFSAKLEGVMTSDTNSSMVGLVTAYDASGNVISEQVLSGHAPFALSLKDTGNVAITGTFDNVRLNKANGDFIGEIKLNEAGQIPVDGTEAMYKGTLYAKTIGGAKVVVSGLKQN